MKIDIQKTKTQMRRGILEFCILSLIAGEEMYPTDIIRTLEKMDLIVKEGTLYPLLSRLKKAKLLTYRWEESELGPPRKYYSLTEDGENFRNDLHAAWDKLVNAVHLTTQNLTSHE